MYLDKLSRHRGGSSPVSRQAYLDTGEGWVYLDKLSRHRGGSPVVISRQVINTMGGLW